MMIGGHCDPRFRRVREVFERHFATGQELGAAFAVFVRGEAVVDLWGGVADRTTGRTWERHTPVLAYSCTKAVAATALLLLAERGQVDLRAPVSELWPEFAANDKAGVTVEHVLSHQAGLPALEEEVPVEEFEDLAAIAARLARQAPLWEPGTAHGYHALTYGFLVGEIIRRVTGKSAGDVVAAEIAGPRGLELWLGAPPDVAGRAARLSAGERTAPAATAPGAASAGGGLPDGGPRMGGGGGPLEAMAAAAMDGSSLMNRAFGNPPIHRLRGGANNPVILRAGWPALGVVTTARGLAGFYRDLVAGEILRPVTLDDALRRRVNGPDRVLCVDSSFGIGYMRAAHAFPAPPAGAGSAFGHTGLGGSLGLGDIEHGIGMAYTMNKMAGAVSGGTRAYDLAAAVYDSLR
ncbi:beta-lactamase family protein [Planotetraspora sp. A-T 1434]|uniref:serine hydrolase domain-containing protein n=1 Tax=Planotetraspora sp. A-T 1434 TaxID=2979219 RepID=UPI0021C1746A|nr:serine hydrolase domain-containing protein [Planotetraspora sp. A-T 1434]MCT9933987.1 beta-lactamase family protein [Planotetraspora sp. A-T 1434]